MNRSVGIDLGAESVRIVEIARDAQGSWEIVRTARCEHHKEPEGALRGLLTDWGWEGISSAAVTGRMGRQIDLVRVPPKQSLAAGFRFHQDEHPATVVSIGSHGFSVLELRAHDMEVFRENSRCSQGTGNFLRQLVERFDLSIEEASELCATIADPAPLSGRCPVILKTDMTHLANKGESKEQILAGLYDAVCENVRVLIKPHLSPPRLMLSGGVCQATRIQESFRTFAAKNQMVFVEPDEIGLFYLEALGTAVVAAEQAAACPETIDALFLPAEHHDLERVPGLASFLPKVKRMPKQALPEVNGKARRLILGFDIGSTGSKAVAIDLESREVIWEGYRNTLGAPVGAAQALMESFTASEAAAHPVLALGATGSGREIVGSLMSTCYGSERVYVLNEIAAHAEGALFFDDRVDTIFEIGGQDAKYIRLAGGRVVDAAMNEACSAGTGSFIEEQGRKFSGIENVVQLGQEALKADEGVSLGQHCSVFMAEIIDEAVASGVEQRSITAGIYDSIIQNYLNRVKGSRSVGQVIFCQGMPFSADALASAVVRQTGSEVVIPPNPGTVGALGIALLTRKALPESVLSNGAEPVEPSRFLGAEVIKKDTFPCKSTQGCGGSGNLCKIDRIKTEVESQAQTFTWGGACSLWDKGTGKVKLPDLSPDPFREREALLGELRDRLGQKRGRPVVAITDEFSLKGLFPFVATFVHGLGHDLEIHTGADQAVLKRGIEGANVPYCAPMQLYHGLTSQMAEGEPETLLLPMIRNLPRVAKEEHATVCPIIQGSADLLAQDLDAHYSGRLVSPIIEVGEGNLHSVELWQSAQNLARELGVQGERVRAAFEEAVSTQAGFDAALEGLGQRALDFCEEQGLIPVVVLGRPYTIYNKVLNSNVPAILREQGAIAIPVDCYPVERDVPVFDRMYWAYGQRNLRAAWQIQRAPGVYSLWASNYSCGPDSFNLHFYAYLMEGKPFAVIETDGHSGDAGTKTRVEAFLHCVREDREARAKGLAAERAPRTLNRARTGLPELQQRGETLLVPRMGAGAEALAATLRGVGVPTEALPMPTRDTVRIGRRHTSGKECVPMTITLGSLLERLEADETGEEKFAFFMPTANGPCRFGVYNILHEIVLERLKLDDRMRIWSPGDDNYFEGVPAGFAALVFTGFAASDLLLAALYDVRPVEIREGAAQEVYDRFSRRLWELLEDVGRKSDLRIGPALLQVANGSLFGVSALLKEASAAFAAVKGGGEVPTVLMVGEIYVRCDPFASGFLIDELEARGLKVRFAPFSEWLEYTDHINQAFDRHIGFDQHLSTFVQRRVAARTYTMMGQQLGWPPRISVAETIEAGKEYIRPKLLGEAILTVGGPLHEWHEGLIDGAVNIGPHECMPAKLAEAQLYHVAERDGLLSLTLPVNGDPIDPEVLDNFAFEVRARFAAKSRPTPKPRKTGPMIPKAFKKMLPILGA
ncbi:MAG: acyl-CoA dehydratase activase-related protein [Deltaproteobacteria bacterium]|nr:acyl-CoA dehydratase activase-related protein [Deltaproteobacteria bacterium]